MSSPRRSRKKHRPSLLSRREFLRRGGYASLALAAPVLPSCSNDGDRTSNTLAGTPLETVFLHGIASGDPLSDRVILWTRVTPPAGMSSVPGSVKVYQEPGLTTLVGSMDFSASAARDFTVKLDFTGLRPGTAYYYRFEALGFQSVIGRTRTAPAAGVSRLRFGVVSCSSYAHGYFNAYSHLAKRADMDAVLHLGDYIYEYGTGEYGDVREYEPPHEILTLDDYRTRHAQYRRDADLREAHRQHPFITVWDDHETANNAWRDGADNHTEGAEGAWVQRKAWAIQAYYEWLPIRQADPGNAERIYRAFHYGDLADLVMLDTRIIDRDLQAGLLDAAAINDEARKLLGPAQLAWLSEQLGAPGATWRLLGQQVMFGQLRIPSLPELSALSGIPIEQLQTLLQSLPLVSTGGLMINTDQWDGYRAERARLFELFESLPAVNAVVLTGDIHTSWCMDLSRDPANPLVYSPLTGSGSLGVEFVCTSITSPGLEQLNPLVPVLQLVNPHMKYVDLAQKGYLLLDITPERLVGEHWYIDTIAESGGGESFGAAYAVDAGARHLVAAEQTEARADAPPLAP